MSALSARTQRQLRVEGFVCDSVERWIPFGTKTNAGSVRGGVRRDFCGFADLLAFGHGRFLAVQVCNQNTLAEHLATVGSNKSALQWVKNGGEVWVAAWRKIKGESRKMHWAPRLFRLKLTEKGHEWQEQEGVFV